VVYYHIKRLVDAGLIVSGSRTRHRDLRASPELIVNLRLAEAERPMPRPTLE
jgi:hypothetical protein